ncbi:hypothetical protein HGM15179_021418, partial [Zosterops borbonicus]
CLRRKRTGLRARTARRNARMPDKEKDAYQNRTQVCKTTKDAKITRLLGPLEPDETGLMAWSVAKGSFADNPGMSLFMTLPDKVSEYDCLQTVEKAYSSRPDLKDMPPEDPVGNHDSDLVPKFACGFSPKCIQKFFIRKTCQHGIRYVKMRPGSLRCHILLDKISSIQLVLGATIKEGNKAIGERPRRATRMVKGLEDKPYEEWLSVVV